MLLYRHSQFQDHDTGPGHPERPERLRTVESRLTQVGLLDRCQLGSFEPVSLDLVQRIHSSSMLMEAQNLAASGGGFLDGDTPICPRSFPIALAAAGTAVAAVDSVLTGLDSRAFCLIRPPGHHATPNRSMGFCLFNNIALAAEQARWKHGLTRILIVDWDVHHGNGTQDIFYSNPEVFFHSIHRFGDGFYPGTGSREETGTGKGLGSTINTAIRMGTTRKEYRDAFRNDLERAAERVKPQLILISAGFDADLRDPIGSLGLDTEDFTELTRMVLDVAEVHCQGRVVSCLEGGYNLAALAEGVETHLKQLVEYRIV